MGWHFSGQQKRYLAAELLKLAGPQVVNYLLPLPTIFRPLFNPTVHSDDPAMLLCCLASRAPRYLSFQVASTGCHNKLCRSNRFFFGLRIF